MDKKTNKTQYVIGGFVAGAVSAACLALMKRIDRNMQKKNDEKNHK